MDVFNFIMAVLVLGGFIGELATAEEAGYDKVFVCAFIFGALVLAASVFGSGIGVIFGRF